MKIASHEQDSREGGAVPAPRPPNLELDAERNYVRAPGADRVFLDQRSTCPFTGREMERGRTQDAAVDRMLGPRETAPAIGLLRPDNAGVTGLLPLRDARQDGPGRAAVPFVRQ